MLHGRKFHWPVVLLAAVLLSVSATVMAQAPARGGGATTQPAAPAAPSVAAPATSPAMGPATPAASQEAPEANSVGAGGQGQGQGQGQGLFKNWSIPVMLIGLLLVFVLMGRKPRQEEKKRKAMLDNLKKGDRITTIGGMIGTIVEVRDNEVMVKVDESSNTRVKFVRSAIRQVGTADESESKEENK
jgi:preprotein translocase subunit YajC